MQRKTRRMQKKKPVIKDKQRKTFIEEFKKFVAKYNRLPDSEEIENKFSYTKRGIHHRLCRLDVLRRRLEKGYYNFA